MNAAQAKLVRDRAENRCEYCHLPQAASPFLTFHLEHIRARQHRGSDDVSNRALACPDCNAFKGPNLTAYTPDTDELVSIFNPRLDEWTEHFELAGPEILGKTPIGRATVGLLNMNDPIRVEMRSLLIESGEF